MAYVLGFFIADGNMIKNKRGAYFISIEITDKDILEKIREVIGSNHKISIRKEIENHKERYRLQIGSKEMFNDLLKLGVVPNKSKVIELPYVPDKYMPNFVRGYFDGDGNVTICNYIRKNRNNKKSITILSGFISGSEKFLQSLQLKIKQLSGIVGGTFHYHNRGYRLYFSVRDSLKLYNFMYGKLENNLFLLRKKSKFEKYFKV